MPYHWGHRDRIPQKKVTLTTSSTKDIMSTESSTKRGEKNPPCVGKSRTCKSHVVVTLPYWELYALRRSYCYDPAARYIPFTGKIVWTVGCIFVCCFLLILSCFLENGVVSFQHNIMIGPSIDTLRMLGGINTSDLRQGQWWRLFSAPFLHAGWLHLLVNVTMLYIVGLILEPDWGFFRTSFVFIISAVMGMLVSATLSSDTPLLEREQVSVGASGGIFGLMGGCLPYVLEYWSTIEEPKKICCFVLGSVVMGWISGCFSFVDNYAHIGGAIAGILAGSLTISNVHFFHLLKINCSEHEKNKNKPKTTPFVKTPHSCSIVINEKQDANVNEDGKKKESYQDNEEEDACILSPYVVEVTKDKEKQPVVENKGEVTALAKDVKHTSLFSTTSSTNPILFFPKKCFDEEKIKYTVVDPPPSCFTPPLNMHPITLSNEYSQDTIQSYVETLTRASSRDFNNLSVQLSTFVDHISGLTDLPNHSSPLPIIQLGYNDPLLMKSSNTKLSDIKVDESSTQYAKEGSTNMNASVGVLQHLRNKFSKIKKHAKLMTFFVLNRKRPSHEDYIQFPTRLTFRSTKAQHISDGFVWNCLGAWSFRLISAALLLTFFLGFYALLLCPKCYKAPGKLAFV